MSIAFCVNSQYSYGDIVAYEGRRWGIIAMRAYQSEHFRPDACMKELLLKPEESLGRETDDEKWVGEVNIK